MTLNGLFHLSFILSLNLYAFAQEIKENEIDSTSVTNNLINTINFNRIDDSIKFSFRAGINNEAEFDSIYNLIIENSDSINQINVNGFNKINYLLRIACKRQLINRLRTLFWKTWGIKF